ncbi:MAG: LPXTG cell wall anchor domain-containing protein [Syntrophomonadaceae bacterium]|nr:LPXTG cell wall anchor domain-containing protein [Syntrophomonadaceae bacterium]MDD4549363.1 LPXTG cell wall anchor domain-containing protein [Syntrophomonadaceae bacterium]
MLESLAAGASHVYKESYTVPAEQAAGELPNTVNVNTSYDSSELSAHDTATVIITSGQGGNQGGGEEPQPQGGIKITKTVSPTMVRPGNEVTYTIIVKNTGEIDLTGVKVVDPMLWEGEKTIGDLPVGESVIIQSNYQVSSGTSSGTTLTNTATVTGYHGEESYTDEVSADLLVKRKSSGGGSSGGSTVVKPETPSTGSGSSTVDTVSPEEPKVEPEQPVADEPQEEVIQPEDPAVAPDEPGKIDLTSVPELPKTGTGNLLVSSMGMLLAAAGGLLLRKRDK